MTIHYLQIQFYAWLVNLIKKIYTMFKSFIIESKITHIVIYVLTNEFFFRNTFHEKLIHFKLHGMCTT